MLRRVSEYLRKCAVEVSDVRREPAALNKEDINGDPINTDLPRMQTEAVPEEGDPEEGQGGPGAPMKPGQFDEGLKPTGGPMIRAPRKQLTHHRKWNPDTRRQLMRDYMRDYRGTGKINERKTQVRT